MRGSRHRHLCGGMAAQYRMWGVEMFASLENGRKLALETDSGCTTTDTLIWQMFFR